MVRFLHLRFEPALLCLWHGSGDPDRQRLFFGQRSPAAERLVLSLRRTGRALLPDGARRRCAV